MIRIECTKQGEYRLYVCDNPMTMPAKGQAIILNPKSPPEYDVRLDNSKDNREPDFHLEIRS